MTTPKTWPADIPFASRRISIDFNDAVFRGQFSRQTQVQQHAAGKSDIWVGIWTTRIMLPAEVARVEGFLASLKGHLNTFYCFDPDRRIPGPSDATGALFAGTTLVDAGTTLRDAGEGISPESGSVNGAGQSGTTLDVTFEVLSQRIMGIGDYFQVGTGFHMLISPADTNGSGDVTLEFEPALKNVPTDGESVFTINPVFIARLDDQFQGIDTGVAKLGIASFSFHEVIQNG